MTSNVKVSWTDDEKLCEKDATIEFEVDIETPINNYTVYFQYYLIGYFFLMM